ncbi:MAG: PqqD family protein [Lachnospiraceae bacterium]|nr:PqqD family protein [Lachnospiraceae bacterium]
MRISKDVVVRQIAGKILLIPTGKAALNANGLISLTPSGELLVRKLQEECTSDDLVNALTDEYEVGREQAAADAGKFLDKLRGFGLLCE